MGFPLIRCQKALLATGNSDPEAAMEWLFAHMEDAGRSFTQLTHYSVLGPSYSDDPGCMRTRYRRSYRSNYKRWWRRWRWRRGTKS